MLMVTQVVGPIRIPFWVQIFVRWNVLGQKLQSWQLTSLQNKYMPSVMLMGTFISHRKNGSVLSIENRKRIVKGQEILRKSTADWDICFKWKDGFKLWKKLSNLKE